MGLYLSISLALFILICLLAGIYHHLDREFTTPSVHSLLPSFNAADTFIKYGYPEIKALSIQLLTLLTAILIFSVTFSEKIINYPRTKIPVRFILIVGWTSLILAIISDGIGLAYNALALPYALTDLSLNTGGTKSIQFFDPAFSSIKAILMSGVFFITGLICIVLAGIFSIVGKPVNNP
jgi:hypothetical protein